MADSQAKPEPNPASAAAPELDSAVADTESVLPGPSKEADLGPALVDVERVRANDEAPDLTSRPLRPNTLLPRAFPPGALPEGDEAFPALIPHAPPVEEGASPGPRPPQHSSGQSSLRADGEIEALDEVVLPSSVQAPTALARDSVLGPDGRLRISQHLAARGRINLYAATWRDETGQDVPAEVREAPVDDPALARESEILSSVPYAMLPRHYASFVEGDRRYLALEQSNADETLAQALNDGLSPAQAISLVLQVVQALRRLHEAGWALVGLSPSTIALGEPVRLTQLGSAVSIGQVPPHPLHVAGYSAPELALHAVVTGKEDVYTLGAMLYHALVGQPIPESGLELGALRLLVRVPGGPQLLAPALATADERIDLDTFYERVLDFKQRLVHSSLALEVASGTTVGLNPSRTVNEDSCGYLTWSTGGADGVSHRALLCVADGMGGMEAGEVASSAALNTALGAAFEAGVAARRAPLAGSGAGPPTLDPVDLVRRAAPAVFAAAEGRHVGTTMTCVFVADGELTLGHVGDTRGYLLRDGVLTQLTADHSLVAALVSNGVITKEQARGHPDSNKVLRSLGSQRELPDRYVDDLSVAYDQPTLQLRPGDWLLLCSDGVWGAVDDEQLRTILTEALDCPTAARALIESALDAGAPDNASTIVARCVDVPSR